MTSTPAGTNSNPKIIVQSLCQLFDGLRDRAFGSEPPAMQPQARKQQHEADYHPRHRNSEQTGNQISKHFRDQDDKECVERAGPPRSVRVPS
jgi:hypothetical protein